MAMSSSRLRGVNQRPQPPCHLLEAGYDTRTVQELLGYKGLNATMIYPPRRTESGRPWGS